MTSKPNPVVGAMSRLVEILEPLEPADRQKAIAAASLVLGGPALGNPSPTPNPLNSSPAPDEELADEGKNIHAKVRAWMKKHEITMEQLLRVFSIDDNAIDVIADKLPGRSNKQKTVEAYVLSGLRSALMTGEPAFADKDARQVCVDIGCYDRPNHASNLKHLRTLATGSKDSGWKLTNPGLNEAARIVKALQPND